jgi:hypothetical protein
MKHITSLLGDIVHRVAASYCPLVVSNINASRWKGEDGGKGAERGATIAAAVPEHGWMGKTC